MKTELGTAKEISEGAVSQKRILWHSPIIKLFAAVTVLKIALMVVFSSGYQKDLFEPFLRHYFIYFDNPWDYFLSHSEAKDWFPYQPVMLYVLAFFCLPLKKIGWDNSFAVNFFLKLPTLVSDITITWLLCKTFPGKLKSVLWYYYLSPIIMYACYMHSQLDLIPTAMLFGTTYFIQKNALVKAAILAGISLATKAHIFAACPLFFAYIWRNKRLPLASSFVIGAILTGLFLIYPYLDSPGFRELVLNNPKQHTIFDAQIDFGETKLYLAVFGVMIVYGRFLLYPKINVDLLDSFLTIVFSVLVLSIVPAPGWYVWMVPFLTVFLIKYGNREKRLIVSCSALYICYLVYFLFFHRFDHTDLLFLGIPNPYHIENTTLTSIAFTILEASLLINIVLFYRSGVKSNSIYKRDRAIVIGIGGDSGSGKSTLLQDLKQLLHDKVVEVEGDADHKWSRDDEHWQSLTHLDPKANFLHRQAETLLNLKRGESVARVDYDHGTGKFTHAKAIHPNDFIVVSGLHTFYIPKSRKIIDLKIFMDPDGPIKHHWKMCRDVSQRNYTQQQVAAQMNRRRNDFDRFISPQRDFADIAISYFSPDSFDANDVGASPNLQLKLSLSSSIELEELLHELTNSGCLAYWDYNEDLARQDLVLSRPLPLELLDKYANEMVPNLEELVGTSINWMEGYRGFVQLMVLIALSELRQEKEDVHEV